MSSKTNKDTDNEIITVNDSKICYRCGKEYGKVKVFFQEMFSENYKGVGHIPICRNCLREMYDAYYEECKNSKDAVRQMCRALNLYWSETLYDIAYKKSTPQTILSRYLAKINLATYSGKTYDDTLRNEGALWSFPRSTRFDSAPNASRKPTVNKEEESDFVSDDVLLFWGPGYTPGMYKDLEQRRKYWMSRFPKSAEIDIGTEALIRQICSLEIDINRDRAAGKSVDKNVNALNSLLGSANLKPVQQKDDTDTELENMPLGVGIQQWEEFRPLPKSKESEIDINKRIKHITTWYVGHAAKMLGLNNSYTQLYEDAMEKLRVKKPEFSDEDDDAIITELPDKEELEEGANP